MSRQLADLFGLAGRVAVVTGGGSGIGAGICHMLADAGAKVVIMDRDIENARAVARDIGRGADAAHIDVGQEESVVKGMADIIARHGVPWLLVNNAGVQDRMEIKDATVEFWDRNYTVNLRGTFLCLREVTNAMVKAGKGGRIVNIASMGVLAPGMPGLAPYAASKGGVVALTQNAALELMNDGITVNAVMPGGVDTPGGRNAKGTPASGGAAMRHPPPLGACTPDDMAAAVLYLAAPVSGRITAQSILVDGGFRLT